MTRPIYIRITVALMAALLCMNAYALPPTITAKLDSTAIVMGSQTLLHYQIVEDKNTAGSLIIENPDYIAPSVDLISILNADTTDLGNNRIQIDRALLIQAFDSGIWEIPAARYVVGIDTFRSNVLNLKVIPIPVDTLKTINGFKDIEAVPFVLTDWIPDFIYDWWWLWLSGLALIALGIWGWRRYKKGLPLRPKIIRVVPPYDEAISALMKLKAENLWQNGQEKLYFTRLTDILRRYIERRFGINAVEMTSMQIIRTLRDNNETKAVNEQLQLILDIADLVKFANERPLPDDNEAAWNRAKRFVYETRPETPEDNTNSDNAEETTTSNPRQ